MQSNKEALAALRIASPGNRRLAGRTALVGPEPVRPVDPAYAVRYLVSDDAAFVQGTTMSIGLTTL